MKIAKQMLIAIITGVFLFSGTAVLAAEKIKVGVSVPSADHGWTAGLLWWAKKAVKDIQAKDKDVTFYVVAASSGSKQVGDVEDLDPDATPRRVGVRLVSRVVHRSLLYRRYADDIRKSDDELHSLRGVGKLAE